MGSKQMWESCQALGLSFWEGGPDGTFQPNKHAEMPITV